MVKPDKNVWVGVPNFWRKRNDRKAACSLLFNKSIENNMERYSERDDPNDNRGGISSRLRDRDLLKKRKTEAQEKETYQWVHGEHSQRKRQRQEKKSSRRRYRRRDKTPEPEPSPEGPSQKEDAQEEGAPLAAPPRGTFLAQEDPFPEQKSSQEPVEGEPSHAESYSQNGSKTLEASLIVDVGPEGENEQEAPCSQETLRIVPEFSEELSAAATDTAEVFNIPTLESTLPEQEYLPRNYF
ncbi:hemogen-like isoform X1 [Acipenser ruthenus]|uniref:hemogen-like isoform X1 n=1 Tax=Acipenser ruthenus TaxID=7906 RepID=UPI00155FFC97|nr:hemogen-like isoform X1 [Acipenser ruthenus]